MTERQVQRNGSRSQPSARERFAQESTYAATRRHLSFAETLLPDRLRRAVLRVDAAGQTCAYDAGDRGRLLETDDVLARPAHARRKRRSKNTDMDCHTFRNAGDRY